MATIGRGGGIADFGWMRISGTPAWLAWLFVHILFLIGFRNRLVVMIQWAWAYVSYQRNVPDYGRQSAMKHKSCRKSTIASISKALSKLTG